MSLSEETIEATLNPDGTLALDHGPALPPGRVRVIIQAAPPAGRRGLADVMDEVRRQQQARGYAGRTPDEMRADEAARREEDEEYDRRMDRLIGGSPAAGGP
jgi:hypothetical protein